MAVVLDSWLKFKAEIGGVPVLSGWSKNGCESVNLSSLNVWHLIWKGQFLVSYILYQALEWRDLIFYFHRYQNRKDVEEKSDASKTQVCKNQTCAVSVFTTTCFRRKKNLRLDQKTDFVVTLANSKNSNDENNSSDINNNNRNTYFSCDRSSNNDSFERSNNINDRMTKTRDFDKCGCLFLDV